MIKILTKLLFLFMIVVNPPGVKIFSGETPSVEGAKVYIINIKNGQKLKSPFLIQFGLTQQMGIAPAMADWPDTGHHHLLINKPKLNHDKPIPKTDNKKYIHFGKGQTEGEIALEPGKYTLQAVFADYSHMTHNPPVVSDFIEIIVE